ncbi:MAG: hypothetical protein ACYS0F_19750 [Planctomycetota bacterium]|jgi:hypothetical protein
MREPGPTQLRRVALALDFDLPRDELCAEPVPCKRNPATSAIAIQPAKPAAPALSVLTATPRRIVSTQSESPMPKMSSVLRLDALATCQSCSST